MMMINIFHFSFFFLQFLQRAIGKLKGQADQTYQKARFAFSLFPKTLTLNLFRWFCPIGTLLIQLDSPNKILIYIVVLWCSPMSTDSQIEVLHAWKLIVFSFFFLRGDLYERIFINLQEIQQEIVGCKSQLEDMESRLRYPFNGTYLYKWSSLLIWISYFMIFSIKISNV